MGRRAALLPAPVAPRGTRGSGRAGGGRRGAPSAGSGAVPRGRSPRQPGAARCHQGALVLPLRAPSRRSRGCRAARPLRRLRLRADARRSLSAVTAASAEQRGAASPCPTRAVSRQSRETLSLEGKTTSSFPAGGLAAENVRSPAFVLK